MEVGAFTLPDPFAGRAWELGELSAALAGAADGRGGLVLVGGEPGIGKTRLVREALAAGTAGSTALWAACWNGEDAPPYWPWVQLVRRLAPDAGPDVDRGALAILVPELSETAPAEAAADHAAARTRLFEAVVGLLRSATAATGPIVVVFDDLHWADEPSLLLLRHLAVSLPDLPVTVVGTYRDTEVYLGPARAELFTDLARAGRTVRLTGLASADVGVLVAGNIEGDVPAGWVEALTERTAGNPLFAKEVLRLLAARGGAEHSLASVPPSVVDVVVQRLARLPQGVTEVLEVAAVIGERFTADDLAGAAGRRPQEVLDALDVASRAGLLGLDGTDFGFTHALVQQALYENLGPARRAQLHRAAGLASEASARPAEVLARHFLAAAALGERDRGLRYGLQAGEAALARLAHEDAATWFERVLDLAGPDHDRAGVEARLGRAEVARRSGDSDAARADLGAVVDAARRQKLPDVLARAALGMVRLGGESGQLQLELVELLEDTVDGLGDDQPDLRALVLSALAGELWDHARDREDDAHARSREALALAERAGNPTTVARCLEARYTIAWKPELAEERAGVAERMAAAARAAGDAELRATAHLLQATALLELAAPRWRDALDRFFSLGEALRLPRLEFLVLTRRGAVAVMSGDFEAATRIIEEAEHLGRRIGEPDTFAVVSHLRWEMARLTGSRGALLGQEIPKRGETYLSLFGLVWPPLIHLDAGDRPGAQDAFQVAAGVNLDEVRRSWIFIHNVADLAEAAVRLGDQQVADRCYQALLPYSGMTSVVSGLVCFGGAVDHHLGGLALARGDAAAAARHLRDAVAVHERLGATPWVDASRALLDRVSGAPGSTPAGALVREAKTWRIAWAGTEIHVPDAKGIRDLAVLLERAGHEVSAGDLYTAQTDGRVPVPDRGDDAVDRQAVAAYRKRLTDLDRELADAEADHDPGRAERAAAERDALIDELRRNFDVHGRPRRLGDTGERARKAVSARLREAIAVIESAHPALGAHLRDAVRTGAWCSYRPAKGATWTVRQI